MLKKSTMKNSLFKILSILLCIFYTITPTPAFAFNKNFGKGYCTLRHPVEAISTDRAACESQHIIQQQSGGTNQENTIWINTTLHSYLDRSSCKPWEKQRPALKLWGDAHIEQAYMMGVWANGYHFFVYNHHSVGTMTLFKWDGATHLLYLISNIINMPQKEINNFAYQIERYQKNQTTQFIDAVVGVLFDLGEVAIGSIYSVVGIIIGTILNPWDTLKNIPPLVTLGIGSVFNAVWLFLKGLAALFTLGAVGSCGL